MVDKRGREIPQDISTIKIWPTAVSSAEDKTGYESPLEINTVLVQRDATQFAVEKRETKPARNQYGRDTMGRGPIGEGLKRLRETRRNEYGQESTDSGPICNSY